jgi:Isochorismatase family
MHQLGILDEVRERVILRRGGVAVFDRLSPRRTAHIVVDLQNGFMAPGQVAEVPVARAIVPNVNRISAALRAAGGLVVFMQHTADAEAIRTWSVYFEHFFTPERRARFIEAFTPGNPGHALWPELDVAEQDMVVIKRRRCLRAGLVGFARSPAGPGYRHAYHFRHRDAGLLRLHCQGCDDDELQSILHHRYLCRPNRCRTCRDTVRDGAHFL